MAEIAYFEGWKTGNRLPADVPQTVDPATGESLYVRYDLQELKKTAHRDAPARYAAESTRSLGMWRYRDVLPSVEPVSLGEGWTPMLQSKRHPGLWIKEEGNNPTGSFKARGLGMAVSMARHYGLRHLAAPSAGNAAGALAAYAAAAGLGAHIYMPQDVPMANYLEGILYGADFHMIDGLISDCGRLVGEAIKAQKDKLAAGEMAREDVWFDISTLKEPFRVEGKKTMGYELCEQHGWRYPDAVFYPTGGGVGLIGMWKAFEEMEALGWIAPGSKRPRMYALQSAGCAPVARAFEEGAAASHFYEGASTFASGLRVPKPYGDAIILEIVRASGGRAVATPDDAILASILDYAKHEGLFLSPEGAAATAAYEDMLKSGEMRPDETVVLFNTGAGLKYVDVVADAMKLRRLGTLPTSMPVGGIITPV